VTALDSPKCRPSAPCGACEFCASPDTDGRQLVDLNERRIARGFAPIETSKGKPYPVLLWVGDIERREVRWLWPGMIPFGKVTIIEADPDQGKSTISLDLAARLATGRPMPDGHPVESAAVILMSAEDDAGDTVAPRLDAARGGKAPIYLLDEVVRLNAAGAEVRSDALLLRDIDYIEESIVGMAAKLLIVDVLTAFLDPGIDAYKDQDVRRVLRPYRDVAERTDCAIVFIRHLKKGGGKAIYRGGGSIAISGAGRSVLVCGPDPNDESGATRVLAAVKGNNAREKLAYSYRLTNAAPDVGWDVARVDWLGRSTVTADDLSAPYEDDAGELETACDFVRDTLRVPTPAKELERLARDAGISDATLKRARKKLHAKATKDAVGGGWRVVLPALNREEAQLALVEPLEPLEPLPWSEAQSELSTGGDE